MLNQKLSELEAFKTEVQEALTTEFLTELQAVFNAHPVITSISWRQYTPSYNDGDPCVFSSHAAYASIWTTRDKEEDKELDWKHESYKAMTRHLGAVSQEQYEIMFGDGFEVTITRTESGLSVDKDEYYG
jgi:hypothetical protein